MEYGQRSFEIILTSMINKISGVKDVETFFHQLAEEGVNAHPDEDFTRYVNIHTGAPTCDAEDAAVRNGLMAQCFGVCEEAGADIYDLMQEIYLKETGLYKYIPGPSR